MTILEVMDAPSKRHSRAEIESIASHINGITTAHQAVQDVESNIALLTKMAEELVGAREELRAHGLDWPKRSVLVGRTKALEDQNVLIRYKTTWLEVRLHELGLKNLPVPGRFSANGATCKRLVAALAQLEVASRLVVEKIADFVAEGLLQERISNVIEHLES